MFYTGSTTLIDQRFTLSSIDQKSLFLELFRPEDRPHKGEIPTPEAERWTLCKVILVLTVRAAAAPIV